MPINQVIAIEIPPPFGVGISCKLLSFGTTVSLFLTAYRIIMYVSKNEINPRMAMADKMKNGFKWI